MSAAICANGSSPESSSVMKTKSQFCPISSPRSFQRWSAWEPGQPKTEIIWRPGYSIFVER